MKKNEKNVSVGIKENGVVTNVHTSPHELIWASPSPFWGFLFEIVYLARVDLFFYILFVQTKQVQSPSIIYKDGK